jgi:hypothetical protein
MERVSTESAGRQTIAFLRQHSGQGATALPECITFPNVKPITEGRPMKITRKKKSNSQTAPIDCGQVLAAVYARMSDDQQRKASIEDQIRNCREAAEEKGWLISEEHIYFDEGKTGTTMFDRPRFAALRAACRKPNPPFRRIIIDDTSRTGRNEADVHGFLDELDYCGINIYYASDGLDSKEPWFRDAFSAKARQDAQFSKTHGKNRSIRERAESRMELLWLP